MALNQLKFDQLETGSVYPITASYALNSSGGGGGTTLTTGSTYPITSSWSNYSISSSYSVSSSYSFNSSTSSFSSNSTSASYSSTASVALNALTASYLNPISQSLIPSTGSVYSLGSPTNKWKDLYVSTGSIYIGETVLSTSGSTLFANSSPVVTLNTASGQLEVSGLTASLSSSYSSTASVALNALNALTSSYSLNSVSSSYSNFATTASYALNASGSGGTTLTTGSSYPITSSWAINALSASYALNAESATTANSSTSASYALTANSSTSASYALTASFALNSVAGASGSEGGGLFTVTSDGFNYNIAGYSGTFPSITVVRGQLYYFNISGVSASHPFALRLSSGNTAAVPGTTNNNPVSGNANTSTLIIYRVPNDAPNSIVYQCTVHSGMIGTINIVNQYGTTLTTGSTYPITSSWSNNALTATSANSATSASYSLSSSYSVNSTTATSSSFASTASYNLNSISSSYALTASFALNASGGGGTTLTTGSTYPITSSWAINATTASYALNASGGGGGSVQTGSIANQTILYNVTTSQDNTITGLNLSSNKWGVTVVEEWNSGSVPGDIYYNSCSLLMHFSGSNGSTTFTDNSPTPKTITSNNGASISTAQSKFGGASGLFDGTDDYLQVPYSTINNLGTGENWTVELWINMPSIPAAAMDIIGASNGGGAVPKWMLAVNMNTSYTYTANRVGFYTYVAGADRWINVNYTWSAGIWYNITAVYDSANTTLYVNGVNVGSLAYNAGSSTNGIRIGSDGEGYKYFTGYIDDLRITKGVARYTGSFTVPDSTFPDTQGTIPQYATKYIGLVGGLNDSNVDYGIEKLSDSSLKIRKMSASGQPLSGSGTLSASVDRVYVNVLDYTNVMVTSSYALTASYVLGGIQTGSISNQTILYNVTTSQDNTITGLDLSGNKWDVSVIEEWNSGSVVGDDYYNSCSLLMHFNGANGSTTFTDNSPSPKTVTSVNGAAISTAQSKFGGTSGLFDGTNDYLSTNSTSAFDWQGNITIECWIYPLVLNGNNSTSYGVVGTHFNFSDQVTLIYIGGAGRIMIGKVGLNEISSTTGVISTSNWQHIAVVKSGSTTTIYVNGSSVASNTTNVWSTGTAPLYIGYINPSNGSYFNGYIDELRITKGVARYTGSFTPQTSAFPDTQEPIQQYVTKYIGLVGGLNDSNVDYGVEKLSDSSLKIRKMTASGQPLSGSGQLSASVDRVYVNVLNYKEVQTTAQSASYAVSASYLINAVSGESFHPFLLG